MFTLITPYKVIQSKLLDSRFEVCIAQLNCAACMYTGKDKQQPKLSEEVTCQRRAQLSLQICARLP